MGSSNRHHADYSNFSASDRSEALIYMVESYQALAEHQDNMVCNLANASSLLWYVYRNLNVKVNWAGFYITEKDDPNMLLLGPFQGKVACQRIQFGRGVCGTAALTQEAQVVPDVSVFPDHIACDGDTKSEIVVPILQNNKTVAIMDLDCSEHDGFSDLDKKYLEKLALEISRTCKF
ncbi:AaceriAFR115Wp [[Ashbya] aceris (nom. inval.)]|nr:AaceriAFR115Wp [[Ashbya] aceris (nom. inval.)]